MKYLPSHSNPVECTKQEIICDILHQYFIVLTGFSSVFTLNKNRAHFARTRIPQTTPVFIGPMRFYYNFSAFISNSISFLILTKVDVQFAIYLSNICVTPISSLSFVSSLTLFNLNVAHLLLLRALIPFGAEE